jgi:anaerobic magnesium-protoporphyrin IX monomethyl ester cyclase
MPSRHVVFVAYMDQPNLGIGYMTNVLINHGFIVEVLDIRSEKQSILSRILNLDPIIVGLSIIFQNYTPDFAELVKYLRDNGVICAICAGGHTPSLEPDETLKAIPGLDFIVRFEGELTLLEIVQRMDKGKEWTNVESIAWRHNGDITNTPLRPLIKELDKLPFPKRWSLDLKCLGIKVTSLLASRGCPRDCTFCSIRRFYSIPPGKVRRTRSPENVIEEIRMLYDDHNVRIFLFQDDDFSLMTKRDLMWCRRFVKCLHKAGITNKILWKINCRSDEVDYKIFKELNSAGLYMVYLGIESGNKVGLKMLNKHISVEQNLNAVDTLKRLGMSYDFGFMLFDPSSTIERVLENVHFLRKICGDGSATASFGKTLPYAGTDLEKLMQQEGRLSKDRWTPDYTFQNQETEDWFHYLCGVFYPWVFGGQSTQAQLRWAKFELDVLKNFYPATKGLDDHIESVTFLIHRYNEIMFRVIEDSAEIILSDHSHQAYAFESIQSASEEQREWIEDQLAIQRKSFFTDADFPLELVLGDNYQAVEN